MEHTPLKRVSRTPESKFHALDREALLKKRDELKVRQQELIDELHQFKEQGVTTDLKPEMQALHDYNDMKDLTQTVLGYLADSQNATLAELHQRFNLPIE